MATCSILHRKSLSIIRGVSQNKVSLPHCRAQPVQNTIPVTVHEGASEACDSHRLAAAATMSGQREVGSRVEVRSVIRFLWAEGQQPMKIHRRLVAVYGRNVVSVQMVRKWCKNFAQGRNSVQDKARSDWRRSAGMSFVLNRIAALSKVLTLLSHHLHWHDIPPVHYHEPMSVQMVRK